MNIKTPVTVETYEHTLNVTLARINGVRGGVIASNMWPEEATELAAIINLHGELVQFVRVANGIFPSHEAQELLAKCEQIGK